MSKYYTPEIEEFHIGFEYEAQQKDESYKPPSERGRWYKNVHGKGLSTKQLLESFYTRVKHLDREDIESSGTIVTDDLHHGKHPSYDRFQLSRKENLKDDLIILFNYSDQWLTIHTHGDTGDVRFYGKVKNKSELKRILKQIGV